MNEELEKKLEELLGLKEQVESLTKEKRLANDEYFINIKDKAQKSKIFYNFYCVDISYSYNNWIDYSFLYAHSVKTQNDSLSAIHSCYCDGIMSAELKHHDTKD